MRVLIFLTILGAISLLAQPALYLIETNAIPQVVEVDQIGVVTNDAGGFAVGTNRVLVTNFVYTLNLIRTNNTPSGAAEAGAPTGGGAIPTGKWSEILSAVIAAIAAAVYHLYRQHKNQQVNASLVQGIETGIQVIKASPEGEAVKDRYVAWLESQQRLQGIQTTVSKLVKTQTDPEVAQMAADSISKPPAEAQT